MSTTSPFKSIKNKNDVYGGKDGRNTFCGSLREHAMEIKFKKKENEVINKRTTGII